MRPILMSRRQDQTGVALVTVLFVAAALTVISSTAAFVTISELRAGNNDRRALAALSYAEAGIDRFVSFIKSGQVTYKDLNVAGCSKPPLALPTGQVQVGTYSASLTVYDPNPPSGNPADRFPIAPNGGACATRPTNPNLPGQADQSFFVITSVGKHPAATRTVRQVIALELIDLPVGVYARSVNMQSSKHPFYTVSMMSETEITHRRSISFVGNDPFYRVEDFFTGATGRAMTAAVPAAAHAAVQNYLFQSRDPEFEFVTKQCAGNGNDSGAIPSQSLWDSDGSAGSGPISSGCPGWAAGAEWPAESKFTAAQLQDLAPAKLSEQDHQTLRDAAQRYGVYCSLPGVGGTGLSTCYKQGVVQSGTDIVAYVETTSLSTNNFITYIDFRSGTALENNMTARFTVWGCNDNPDLSKSVVTVVRNGGVDWGGAGGNKVNGALIIDGDFAATGSFEFNGSIVAGGTLNIRSSSQKFGINECWVQNMPAAFFRSTPVQWAEVDR